MKKIVVIGGGVAGLGAAYKVKRAADEGHDVAFTLRREGRPPRRQDRERGRRTTAFVVDGGPDCFLTEKPAVHRIAKLIGIEDDKLPTDEARKRTLILSRGRLHEMPDGVMMFAPTKFVPFATTGLFSWPGKIRVGDGPVHPAKERWAEGETRATRRDARELRRAPHGPRDPRPPRRAAGGRRARLRPAQMSLAATFPRLLEMEQKYGSMIGGFLDAAQEGRGDEEEVPAEARREAAHVLHALHAGHAGAHGRAWRTRPAASSMRTGRRRRGDRARDGDGWTRRRSTTARSLEARRASIVATEGWAAAELLAAAWTRRSPTRSAAIPHSLLGDRVAGVRRRATSASTSTPSACCARWSRSARCMACTLLAPRSGRAARPRARCCCAASSAGRTTRRSWRRRDEELVEIVVQRVPRHPRHSKAKPIWSPRLPLDNGMPQYTMGHLDRVDAIEERCAAHPGLGARRRRATAASACRTASRAARRRSRKVLGEWGIDARRGPASRRSATTSAAATRRRAAIDRAEHRRAMQRRVGAMQYRVLRSARPRRCPSTSVTRAPASRQMTTPAAMSHGLSANSQKPSARPHATWQQSMAAEPSRRMSWTGARRKRASTAQLAVERRRRGRRGSR